MDDESGGKDKILPRVRDPLLPRSHVLGRSHYKFDVQVGNVYAVCHLTCLDDQGNSHAFVSVNGRGEKVNIGLGLGRVGVELGALKTK